MFQETRFHARFRPLQNLFQRVSKRRCNSGYKKIIMVNDSLGDFIIRLKNASLAKRGSISVPYSKLKHAVADVLQKEGFVNGVEKKGKKVKKFLEVALKYNDAGQPEITGVKRVSKLGKRIYVKSKDIRRVKFGHGRMLISTPKGIMTDSEAKKNNMGGEALFSIW